MKISEIWWCTKLFGKFHSYLKIGNGYVILKTLYPIIDSLIISQRPLIWSYANSCRAKNWIFYWWIIYKTLSQNSYWFCSSSTSAPWSGKIVQLKKCHSYSPFWFLNNKIMWLWLGGETPTRFNRNLRCVCFLCAETYDLWGGIP